MKGIWFVNFLTSQSNWTGIPGHASAPQAEPKIIYTTGRTSQRSHQDREQAPVHWEGLGFKVASLAPQTAWDASYLKHLPVHSNSYLDQSLPKSSHTVIWANPKKPSNLLGCYLAAEGKETALHQQAFHCLSGSNTTNKWQPCPISPS